MTTTAPTPADITQRNHRQAVRFFWTWLILTTVVSLAGNVAHAWLTAGLDARWLAASVAAVPPTVLLMAVHGLALLAKATASGGVYRASVVLTGILAIGAFMLSFVALRDLAVIAGIRPGLAPVLPLVIDLAIGAATLALGAIGDKPARRTRNSSRGAADHAPAGVSPNRATATEKSAPAKKPSRDDMSPTAAESASPTAGGAARGFAAELVAAKVTRQPVAIVEAILAARDAGDARNRIAKDLGIHHSAVSKVIEAAAQRNHRSLMLA